MAVARSRLAGVVGPILVFIGALLLTAAITLPIFVAGKLKNVPLDVDVTSVSDSTVVPDSGASAKAPAKIIDLCSVEGSSAVVNDAHITAQERVVVTEPSDAKTMTFQAGFSMKADTVVTADGKTTNPPISDSQTFVRDCGDGLLLAWVDKVSINRATAEPNSATSEATFIAGDKAVQIPNRTGLQYRFPTDVAEGGDYQYFDVQTRRSVPLTTVGTEDVIGASTVHFRAEVPATDLSTVKVSGDIAPIGTSLQMSAKWWGIDGPADNAKVTLHRWAKATYDFYVDQKSGVIVKKVARLNQYYAVPADPPARTSTAVKNFQLPALDTQLTWSAATIEAQAKAAKDAGNAGSLVSRVLPIVLGVLGVIAILIGILALLIARRGGPAEGSPTSGDPAYGPGNGYGPETGYDQHAHYAGGYPQEHPDYAGQEYDYSGSDPTAYPTQPAPVDYPTERTAPADDGPHYRDR